MVRQARPPNPSSLTIDQVDESATSSWLVDQAPWSSLPTAPGLCSACQYALLNQTRRGTVYLRCGRATWDERLTRYPRLPVDDCLGFLPNEAIPGEPKPGGRASQKN